MMRKLLKRLSIASLIYGFGDLITKSAAVLLIPVYTQILTPAEYGVLSSINIMNIFLGGLITLNLNSALAKFHYDIEDPCKRRDYYGSLFLFVLIWGLFITIFLNTIGAPFLNILFKNVRFEPYLKLGTWIVLATSMSLLPLTMLQVQEKPMKYRSLTTVGFFLSSGLIIFFVVFLHKGVLGSLYGQLISGVIMGIIFIFFMIKNVNLKISWDYLRTSIMFSLPIFTYSIGGWITEQSSRYFVERYTTLKDLGLFNLASQYCYASIIITNAINMAWMPLFYETSKKKMHRLYLRNMGFYTSVFLAV